MLAAAVPGTVAVAESVDSSGPRAILKITDAQSLPTARRVTIPHNKSLLVEMPVDRIDKATADWMRKNFKVMDFNAPQRGMKIRGG